jgi:hypothetical protein
VIVLFGVDIPERRPLAQTLMASKGFALLFLEKDAASPFGLGVAPVTTDCLRSYTNW